MHAVVQLLDGRGPTSFVDGFGVPQEDVDGKPRRATQRAALAVAEVIDYQFVLMPPGRDYFFIVGDVATGSRGGLAARNCRV